jgi:hypothetical protein
MARDDFPFNRLELNLQPIVARPRVRPKSGVPLNDRAQETRHADQRDNRQSLHSLDRDPAGGRRRRLTRLWKQLPAQTRPVITRANNSKLPTTTTALDQPNQINRLNASAMDKIAQAASGILSSIKMKQDSAGYSVSRSNLARD